MPDNHALHLRLMEQAIAACTEGIDRGESPFGALIATVSGEIVCRAHNGVRSACDPTAHAEVEAIRAACRTLDTIDLSGHLIVSTCEPCPMCASAIHWARLDAVVFGAGIDDALRAGFNELAMPIGSLYRQGGSRVQVFSGVLEGDCRALFELWKRGPSPRPY